MSPLAYLANLSVLIAAWVALWSTFAIGAYALDAWRMKRYERGKGS